MAVTAIGWRAHAALRASGGKIEVIARLSSSVYARAAGELIWIGPPGTPLHGRSVAVSEAPVGASWRLTVDGVAPWRPPAISGAADRVTAARILGDTITALGEPRGLCRLTGEDLVTSRARPHVLAVARACAADDAVAFAEAARPLLGLGTGLTPSGDDFVGGALFARRIVPTRDGDAWNATAAHIVAEAATLTHEISARLLGDLANGEGWAPLHDLAHGLADGEPARALSAARELTALGHTSGWDILAGFSIGLAAGPSPG
jgi:hypothetical protein